MSRSGSVSARLMRRSSQWGAITADRVSGQLSAAEQEVKVQTVLNVDAARRGLRGVASFVCVSLDGLFTMHDETVPPPMPRTRSSLAQLQRCDLV